LSNVEVADVLGNPSERWCNQVAAEILVPLDEVERRFDLDVALAEQLQLLARTFRVSTLVVIRRVRDAGFLEGDEYWDAYRAERDRVMGLVAEGGPAGGNFYNTQPVRVSKRFAKAVITSALEGQTLYRDALQMLGIRKLSTFKELTSHLDVA
jgi:Zn-dependent peptidase ImmA (M78 family)